MLFMTQHQLIPTALFHSAISSHLPSEKEVCLRLLVCTHGQQQTASAGGS